MRASSRFRSSYRVRVCLPGKAASTFLEEAPKDYSGRCFLSLPWWIPGAAAALKTADIGINCDCRRLTTALCGSKIGQPLAGCSDQIEQGPLAPNNTGLRFHQSIHRDPLGTGSALFRYKQGQEQNQPPQTSGSNHQLHETHHELKPRSRRFKASPH